MMVPIFFHGVMVLLCWNFPIDRRRHGIIKKRLHAIAAREGVLQDA
jgi:Na+/melibiose symporter-like transporter